MFLHIRACFSRCAQSYFSVPRQITLYPHLLLCKAEIRLAFVYCSQLCDEASPTSLSLLGRLQRNDIRLNDDPSLPFTLQSLVHRRQLLRYSFSTVISLVFVLRKLPQKFLFLYPFPAIVAHRQLVNLTKFLLFCVVLLSFFSLGIPNCGTLAVSVFPSTYNLSPLRRRISQPVLTRVLVSLDSLSDHGVDFILYSTLYSTS